MKKFIFLAILVFSFAVTSSAQIAVPVKKGATLPATCTTTDTQTLLFYKTGASNGLYYCSATNTWTKFAAGTFIAAPGSTTDNAIVRFDGTSGQIQNSPVTIAETTGAIAGAQSLTLSGSTSGTLLIKPAAIAGTNTLTLPAGTTDLSATGGTSQVVQQTTSGGALTVGQLAASNLSNGTTGSGSVVLATSPTLVTPALGTPSALVGTNITGTAASLTAGAATALAANPTDCSANNYATTIAANGNLTCSQVSLSAGVTGTLPVANGGTNASVAGITAFNNITGYTAAGATGTTSTNLVFSTSPTLVTPVLGTPTSVTLTNGTGLPLTTGVTGTLPVANGGTGVTTSTGSGNNVLSTSPTLVTPILGTPTSVTLTNGTGLPLTTGVTGTLPVANGGTGVTTSTGSGNNVLSTSPTLVTPILGTPTSVTLTNGTGLPLTTGVTGTLPIANGGTNATTAATALSNLGGVSKTWTVVASASSSVSPTAADSGKYYRLSNASATFNLPTTGLVVGETEFWVTFTGGLGTINSGTGNVIEHLNNDVGNISGASQQSAGSVYTYQLIHLRYVAANVWASDLMVTA